MFLPRFIIVILLMNVSCRMHATIDVPGIAKEVLFAGAIAAYPVYDLARTLDVYYSNTDHLDAEKDFDKDSLEYHKISRSIPGMRMHGKPVLVKSTADAGIIMAVANRERAFYVLINQKKVQHAQSLVDACFLKSNKGLRSVCVGHECGHIKNNDGSIDSAHAVAMKALLVGLTTQYLLQRMTQKIGIPSVFGLPISVGSTWATIKAHHYWQEYSADKDAYCNAVYHEVASAVTFWILLQRKLDVARGTSIIKRAQWYTQNPHPYPLARAHMGNEIIRERFGKSRVVNVSHLYDFLKENLNINEPL